MTFSITDRLQLIALLPEKGDAITLRMVRDAQNELSFSAEEHAMIDFERVDNGNVVWDKEKDPHKDITLRAPILAMLITSLEKLNNEKELTLEQLDLYDLLVQGEMTAVEG